MSECYDKVFFGHYRSIQFWNKKYEMGLTPFYNFSLKKFHYLLNDCSLREGFQFQELSKSGHSQKGGGGLTPAKICLVDLQKYPKNPTWHCQDFESSCNSNPSLSLWIVCQPLDSVLACGKAHELYGISFGLFSDRGGKPYRRKRSQDSEKYPKISYYWIKNQFVYQVI